VTVAPLSEPSEEARGEERDGSVAEIEGEALDAEDGGALGGVGKGIEGAGAEVFHPSEGREKDQDRNDAEVRIGGSNAEEAEKDDGTQEGEVDVGGEGLGELLEEDGKEKAEGSRDGAEEAEGPDREVNESVILRVERDEVAHHGVEEKASENDLKGERSREDPLGGLDRGLERGAEHLVGRVPLFSVEWLRIGHAEGAVETEERLDEDHRDGKAMGEFGAEVETRDSIEKARVVEHGSCQHRDEKGGRTPAHDSGEDIVPTVFFLVLGEGVKGEGLVRTRGGRFRGAGEDAIDEAHPEEKPAPMGRSEEEQGHLHNHEGRGKDDELFSSQGVGKGSGGNFKKKNGTRPHRVEDDEVFERQSKIEKEDRKNGIVGPGIVEDREPSIEADIPVAKGAVFAK